MSFNITASGPRDEVIRQLRTFDLSHGGHVAEHARTLLIEQMGKEPDPAGGYLYHYVVKAACDSGGGSALSLSLSVEPHYVTAAEQAAG